ncbi:MAG: radical SAM protein, partial [Pseudomonadota bacterium]
GLYIRLMKQAETMGLPAMTFGYLSEPLLRPDIAEMISLARDAGVMDIRLGTNGTLLGKKVAKELIRAGLTRLEVSLDALDPHTYRSIRRGGSLPKVVRNIMDFLELRSAMGSRIPVLRLSFLRLPQNEAELEGFLSFWRDKAELFSIQEPIFYPEAPLSKLVDLTEGPPSGNFRCAQPWQRLIIRSNGDVYPCCSQLSPKMKVGSAKQDSLLELWQSRLMQGLRQAQKEGRYREYPDCLDCAAGAARRHIRRTPSADGERA